VTEAHRHIGKKLKMTQIKTFRDLVIWQKSMTLVTEIYKITKTFPNDETYCLTGQMRRCAISIPSNIAEGYGRNTTNDYIRFLRVAISSLYELQTQLEISLNLKYLDGKIFQRYSEAAREIERMLSSLMRKLENKDKE
jgi:four helix bundle protein